MNFTKKMLLTSTVLLSMAAAHRAQAEEVMPIWTARTVEEVKSDLVVSENTSTYTVKYGDTLSVISEAMNIDMTVLANINQITNLDLIFPEAVLTTTYDENKQVTAIEIEMPVTTNSSETVVATADLETNEVTVDDQTTVVEDLTVPQEETTENTENHSEDAPAEEVVQEETAVVAEEMSQPAETNETVEPATETPNDAALSDATSTETSQAPTVEIPAENATPAETATPAVDTSAALNNPENAGLQPQTAAYKEEVAGIFGITSFSLYRAGANDDHGKGLAVDFMVPVSSELGDQVAQYSIDNMSAKGISYIIWKQRFYSPYPSIYGPAYTWNLMPDRGSVTQNHYDHVHVSFNE